MWFLSAWVGTAISSKIWARKAREIAKPSYWWEAAKGPIPCGEWKDPVCLEKRSRTNSFAAVLPMLGYSNMYKTECELMSHADLKCYNSEYECLWLTLFFICRLKINHGSIGHMRLFLKSAPSWTVMLLTRFVANMFCLLIHVVANTFCRWHILWRYVLYR